MSDRPIQSVNRFKDHHRLSCITFNYYIERVGQHETFLQQWGQAVTQPASLGPRSPNAKVFLHLLIFT